MEIPILLTVAFLSVWASVANSRHERKRWLAEWKLRDPVAFKAWLKERTHRHGGSKFRPVGI